MERIILIYSLAMAVAGASLVAEAPPQESEPEPTPARMTAQLDSAPPKRLPVSKPEPKPLSETAVPEPEPRLGTDAGLEIHFLVGEIDLDTLKLANPEIQSGGASVSLVDVFAGKQREFTMTPPEFRAIRHCLESLETLNVVATSQVIAQSGQTAQFQQAVSLPSGPGDGVQTVSGEVRRDRLETGLAFEAKLPASPQGPVQIQIDLGDKSPVRPASRISAGDLDVCPGETCVTLLERGPGADASTVTFIAVTVNSANPLQPIAETIHLEPIPEQSDAR